MRLLAWDGCVNVRDLGGLPLETGGTTRHGRVVRADDIAALSEAGWRALTEHGVRTAIDLRFPQERTEHPPHASPLEVVRIPLFGRLDRAESARVDGLVSAAADAAEALAILYTDALETHAERIAAAVSAVDARLVDGAVLVHCAIGKDRTGIVSALLLRVAGVAAATVADDYAISHVNVASLVDPWIDEAADEAQRTYRQRMCAAPRDGMLGMLTALDDRHGGAVAYLRQAGVDDGAIGRLRLALTA